MAKRALAKRAMIGLAVVAACVVGFRVVSASWRRPKPVVLAMGFPGNPHPQEERANPLPQRPGLPEPELQAIPAADEPQPISAALVPGGIIASSPAAAKPDDPMAAVDSFLDRNRKEADDAIKALSDEAEALRARLERVEAALARWKAVADALDQGTKAASVRPPAPAGRIRWKQPDKEAIPPGLIGPAPAPAFAPQPEPPPVLPDPGPDATPILTPAPARVPTPGPGPSSDRDVPVRPTLP